MRHRLLRVSHFVVAALLIAGALALPALAQPARGPARPLSTVIGPYHPVPIKLPPAMNDPSFEAFRKQLADVAEKKDRAALAHLVAANFFWIPEDKDLADKSKPAIDNLAKAFNLNGSDGFGWEALSAYAAETTAGADPLRPGVICAPAEATFDDNAADQLVSTTHTDASDWAYPVRDGLEVRAAAQRDAPVVDKLGLYLVRVLPDESPATVVAAFIKVVTSSGKIGYVETDSIFPIGGEQLCYAKEADGWKIAGFLGGDPNQ